ncbi:MAG: hypothetical protein KDA96_04330, partial [Planctomycetaceae bacterium]|nr:hypothetical protein [Planctomycetaceae bacterium]
MTVNALTAVSLTARSDLGTVSNTGLTAATSGSNSAALTVSGTVTAPTITLSAVTNGTVTATSTSALATATNTWTDSAVVTINGGAVVTGTNVSILANRQTRYSATGRNAKNVVSGDTRITVGQVGTGAAITAGTSLSMLADNHVTVTATSPDIELNLDTLAWPAAIEVAIARNEVSGNTGIVINDSALAQNTSGGAGTALNSRRQVEAVAEAGTDALSHGVIPNGAAVTLAGSYASNVLEGDVSTSVTGGTISGTDVSIEAHDAATAMVKSGLSATSQEWATAVNSPAFSLGESVALNLIGGSGVDRSIIELSGLTGDLSEPAAPSNIAATVTNTPITVTGGSLNVDATNDTRVNSTISNAAETESSALYGSGGGGASGLLAANLVNSRTHAEVVFSSPTTASATTATSVTAANQSQIASNIKLVTSSMISNDGGARWLQSALTLGEDYEHEATSGSTSLAFGDRVRKITGSGVELYQWLGTAQSRDLSAEDYSDLDYWKPVPGTNIIPDNLNITPSNSVAIGGLLSRNIVASDVDAVLRRVNLTSGDITLAASDHSSITAETDAAATATGTSAFGEGISLAASGTIAVNTVNSSVDALIDASSLTASAGSGATGSISVTATNDASITATNEAAVSSSQASAGVMMAFNSIGYIPSSTFLDAMDTLLGTSLGTENPAVTSAKLTDTKVTASGNVTVEADSSGSIEASIGNEATAVAAALKNITGISASGILASNRISSTTDATISFASTTPPAASRTIQVGGSLTVSASDESQISADTTLLSKSTVTNDAGVSLLNTLAQRLMEDYQFSSLSGSRALAFGDLVRVASTHTSGGTVGKIYKYMGTANTLNLTAQDYSNYGLWKQLDPVNILPPGLNVTGSDSLAFGGMIVRNDLKSDVDALISKAVLDVTANTGVTAASAQRVLATSDATVTASGVSAFGAGGAIAVNSTVTTNTIQGKTNALIDETIVSTDGNLSVTADNTAEITAVNRSAISSNNVAAGSQLAFNIVGYAPQATLFAAMDALLGTGFGTANSASAEAMVRNSSLDVGADAAIVAHDDVLVSSESTNESKSATTALMNANSASVGVGLASNMISSTAFADLQYTTAWLTAMSQPYGAAIVDGNLTVESRDRSGIQSVTQLDSTAITNNDGGISTLNQWLGQFFLNQYDYTSLSGTVNLTGSDVQFLSTSGTQTVFGGDRVLVPGTASDPDRMYTFIAVAPGASTSVNLGAEDYSNVERWFPVLRRSTARVRVAPGHAAGGVIGAIYRYTGTALSLDLGTQDYSNTALWERIDESNADYLPSFGNLTKSNAVGVGVNVARNQVDSSVAAGISHTAASVGGDISVRALEEADIEAEIKSTVSVAGGSQFAQSTVVGVNATVATNTILSSAIAEITDSAITTPGGGSAPADADVTVHAENHSSINARLKSATRSAGPDSSSVGVTLAFNTLGYESQNVLFNTIDALLGTDIGDAAPARVLALVRDTPIDITGDIAVTALNDSVISSAYSNLSALDVNFGDAAGSDAAASIMVASNMLQTDVDAEIVFSEPGTPTTAPDGSVTADGTITVAATDNGIVLSTATTLAAANAGASFVREVAQNVLARVVSTPYDFLSSDGVQSVDFGDVVRVALNHSAGGDVGAFYRYMGTAASLDLKNVNYTDIGYWQAISLTPVPAAVDVVDSEGTALGGVVVRNDARVAVDSRILNTAVTAGSDVTVSVLENAAIQAVSDIESTATGSTAFGEDSSLATNAIIVTNLVLSDANALISDSTVTTTGTGDLVVDADNTAFVNARNLANTRSGNASLTGTLAVNTIGWEAQDIFSQAIDTLLGNAALGDEAPMHVSAIVEDTPVTAAGDISITADNKAKIKSVVSNETSAKNGAIQGGDALALGVVLSSNLVSSQAEAAIRSTAPSPVSVSAGGALSVASSDQAVVDAKTLITAIATTTQDVGIGLLLQALLADHGIDFTDRSGSRTVTNGDYVQLDAVDFLSSEIPDEVSSGQRIKMQFEKKSGATVLWSEGDVYEYIGASPLTGGVDLEEQTYTNATLWKKVQGQAGRVYQYLGATGTVNLGAENYNNTARWAELSTKSPTELVPGLMLNPGESSAAGFGFLVTRNDVHSDVDATMTKVTASAAGNLSVTATESARINATDLSTVTAKGGSFSGKGTSVAVDGVVAGNTVRSSADAVVSQSALTTTDNGDVMIAAANTSLINANVRSDIFSHGVGLGITMAFNTIGWETQNFLFNAVDALIGSTIGTADPAVTKAQIINTTVNAAGDVSVTADSSARIDARVAKSAIAMGIAPGGGTTDVAVSAVMAMNKVATDVDAIIDTASTFSAAGVTVSAQDQSSIKSDVAAGSIAISVGSGNTVSVPISISFSRNELSQTVDALLSDVGTPGTSAIIGGDVNVSASKTSTIDAKTAALAIAVSATPGSPVSVSGGGAIAFNSLVGTDNALLTDSYLQTTAGDVNVTATDDSAIDAEVRTIAASIAIGGGTSPAVALGMSVAMNDLGWNQGSVAHDYTNQTATGSLPVNGLQPGKKVKVLDGPLTGRVYEYIGDAIPLPADVKLGAQDYYDRRLWKQVGTSANASQIHADVVLSRLAVDGELNVTADATQTINAVVNTNALALGVSGGTAVGVSAAGVFTQNEINADVRASIQGPRTITANSVDVVAEDTSTIVATAEAIALAAALGPSVSVAGAIGVTVAINEISSSIMAYVTGMTITTTDPATGDVNVLASEVSTITSEAASASAAAAIGEIGVAISGAGAYASNVILTTVYSIVDSSDVSAADDVTLSATSSGSVDSTIKAVSAAAGGGLVGVGVAIGVGLARNYVGYNPTGGAGSSVVQAWIAGSEIDVDGTLTVLADNTSTINAEVEAAAVALAAGKFAVAGAGTGVSALNRIGRTIRADITDSAGNGIRIHDGALTARDSSTITSTTEAASLAAGIGIGGGIAIAVSLAENQINNVVFSNISNATILTISDWATSSGSQALASGDRVRVAGGFTDTTRGTVGTVYRFLGVSSDHTSAHEQDYLSTHAPLVVQVGDIVKVASGHAAGGTVGDIYEYQGRDHQYTSDDGSQSLTNGDRVLLAAGYPPAKGVAGRTYEFIGSGTPTVNLSTEDYLNAAQWKDVSLLDVSAEDFTSAFWKNVSETIVNSGERVEVSAGHSAGGNVGQVYQYLGRPVQFTTLNNTQTVSPGNRVSVAATYDAAKAVPGYIYEFIGASATSIDLSTEDYLNAARWRESVAIDLTAEDFSNTSVWQNVSVRNLAAENYRDTALWQPVSESFVVMATETAAITATSKAASVSAGLGAVSGGGANSKNMISTGTRSIVDSSLIELSGDLDVIATLDPSVSTVVGNVSIAAGISLAGGGSVAEVTIVPTVEARLSGIVVAQDVDVNALVTPKATAYGYGVNAGTLAVGVSKSTISIAPIVRSTADGAIHSDSLTVRAQTANPTSGRTATAITTGSAGGALVGVDATYSTISHGGTVSSSVAAGSNLHVAGTTTIAAGSTGGHFAKADSFASGVVAVGASTARANSSAVVTASIGDNALIIGGSVYLSATRDHDQFADNFAGGGGVVAGASAIASTSQSGAVQAQIGNSANLNLTDTFDAGAVSTATLNGRVRTFSGGLLAGAGAEITNTVNSPVTTSVGTSAQITAHNIVMDAGNAFRKPDLGTDNIRGTTGGLVSAAGAVSTTVITFDTKVDIGSGVHLTGTGTEAAPGEFSLRTINDIRGVDKISFVTGGALSGAGAFSTI